MVFIALLVCFLITTLLTPYVKKLALKMGATDQPDKRKVHEKIMPRLGGLGIYISIIIGSLLFLPKEKETIFILVGATLIALIGVLDDIFSLSPKVKFLGQIIVAILTIFGGIKIEFLTLPFVDRLEFGIISIPLTILWIVGITNSINLTDGLDGLAAGISSIALLTISTMALSIGNTFVALLGFIVVGSTLGFLLYNFHPAKIFMGDTGSLLLGYMISILSIMGLFKNVTFFSILVPIIILGVPILDTLFAIIRRILLKKPLSAPDKLHLHHCLLRLGFTHRQTVLLIYAMSCIFSTAAIIFTRSTLWGSTITLIFLLIAIELTVELTGLVGKKYKPIINFLSRFQS
ncbi:glycosyltransferase family 4 protein [Gracilibacillus kekensis]|uniref:UDP-GlcNAc:undecaprenyl-phosphate GlcNAc-1-phosphate transferase n=1 Tax=Gracilibacillus kekensis TaxID=1027249 RepID=A0A1M7K6J6_9BACI|nr:MraY family glycosyltransferase [Gracilibacillus kekensis]SHM60801.1 UDP-GlcNAc:undecaprenyl-phosphate GlcNAc-1-phosphate transferase [Gracilibacillus kekensis]